MPLAANGSLTEGRIPCYDEQHKKNIFLAATLFLHRRNLNFLRSLPARLPHAKTPRVPADLAAQHFFHVPHPVQGISQGMPFSSPSGPRTPLHAHRAHQTVLRRKRGMVRRKSPPPGTALHFRQRFSSRMRKLSCRGPARTHNANAGKNSCIPARRGAEAIPAQRERRSRRAYRLRSGKMRANCPLRRAAD